MIGSNDSVSGVAVATYEKAVEAAIARIDGVLADGPRACHLLVHTFRRYGVSAATWGGHALIADRVLDVLADGIGTRRERSRLDTDRDGLTDRQEVRRGSDPTRAARRR